MKCTILHESPGRMRVHTHQGRMTLEQADLLEQWLLAVDGVRTATVYDRTCDAIIRYTCPRERVLRALARFSYADPEAKALAPERSSRAISRSYQDRLFWLVARRYLKKLLLPAPIRHAWTVLDAGKFLWKGLKSLLSGRIEVALLDAVAIGVSLLRRDFDTASSVMFLLNVGDVLEEWTHKKSVDDLARTMALNVDQVWLLCDGQEVLTPLDQVASGDSIVVRAGNVIPLDGVVISGEATVNQASITGESLPVRKDIHSSVYAGTVVEEGECVIQVTSDPGDGKYDRIIRMVEQSEKLKSATEARAEHLADRLVPYTLGGAALTWLLTRNVEKAVSILMVDFSCALKLSMPLAFLSAMRESSRRRITVKGGKFLEAMAEADTIVFDKTGTLTYATPRVARVIPFGDNTEAETLRLAACLEEHFPHSIANAVVQEAAARGLLHQEEHAKVDYVVAHGIASSIDGEPLLIGSYHFVFEDEGCVL
ncbi:MAG: HAD-IC family P-type ATPase, partial [Oscillospiraceae bacterium]|nr:HAD-IC family P-type ATPase [Oscillospiraceae bacterium]